MDDTNGISYWVILSYVSLLSADKKAEIYFETQWSLALIHLNNAHSSWKWRISAQSAAT